VGCCYEAGAFSLGLVLRLNGMVFSFWSVLTLLLGNDKNEVFSLHSARTFSGIFEGSKSYNLT
jgi:hypothetical protein